MHGSKKTKIGIIQLGSSEYLLFSLGAIAGLKAKHANAEIHLFANRKALAISDEIPGVDHVISVEANNNNLFAVPPTEFDLIVNLDFNKQAAQISGQLNAQKRIGPFLNKENAIEINDSWSKYFATVVESSDYNPFHIVDLYNYIAQVADKNVGPELFPTKEDVASRTRNGFSKGAIHLGIHLSSPISEDDLKIIVNNQLHQNPNVEIHFLGNLGHSKRAKKIINGLHISKYKSRCHNHCGSLTPRDLPAVCFRLDVLISSLSLELYTACSCGTFTLYLNKTILNNIYGPFGHGHLLITGLDERKSNHELISKSITHSITKNKGNPPTENQWKNLFKSNQQLIAKNTRIKLAQRIEFTQENNSSRTDIIYSPLHTFESTLDEGIRKFYRLIWQFDLHESHDTLTSIAISKKLYGGQIKTLVEVLEKAHQLVEIGKKYTKYTSEDLKNDQLNLARSDSQKLQEIDNLLDSISDRFPMLKPLFDFYHIQQSQIFSNDPVVVAELTGLMLDRLNIQICLLIDLIHSAVFKTVDDSKKKTKINYISKDVVW